MQIGIIVSQEFNDAIERYCSKTSLTKSDYIRTLIREDLIEKKIIKLAENGGEMTK